MLKQGDLVKRPALETPLKQTCQLFDVNFFGSVELVTVLIQKNDLPARKHGHVVVTSSSEGKTSTPTYFSYSTSKHALNGFFAALRAEHAPWLRVDLVCPGPVQTDIFDNASRPARKQSIAETAQGKI